MRYRTVPGWLIPFLLGMSAFGLTFYAGPENLDPATARGVGPQSAPPIYLPLIYQNYSEWLNRVNTYRRQAQLPDLSENAEWSFGARRHAIYMVKTDEVTDFESQLNHPAWYTPEGDAAARNSLLIGANSESFSDSQAIDYWMRSPFQALSILDPELRQTGFGSYREAGGTVQTAAALDVRRGYVSGVPAGVAYPVTWPGDGQVIGLRTYSGYDSPNPFDYENCKSLGFNPATAGLPILLQVGSGSATGPTVNRGANPSTLLQGSTPQPHCLITAADLDPQNKDFLAARDAIVLIPQNPLVAGATYTVSITATPFNGSATTYTWSFSVAANAP